MGLAIMGCWATDGLTISPLTLTEGSSGTLVVNLEQETADKYCAFQFDLYLPEGVEIVSETGTNGNPDYSGSFTLTSSRVSGHIVNYSQREGFWRIMVYSNKGSKGTFSDTEGTILEIKVTTNDQFAVGTKVGNVKNIVLTYTQDLTTSYLQNDFTYTFTGEEQSYLLGDVNADGEVDIFDVMDVQSYIEGNIPDVFIFRAGDTDEDGDITIFDLMDIVDIALNN